MATLQFTETPILQHPAQMLILPVNNAGIILDPVIARCKTLYPDNYQRYRKACMDGQLQVGSSLLVKRQRDHAGLSASSNGNRPNHIANLVVCDHPYHPTRRAWLNSALDALKAQLYELMRYEGIRSAALLARPLIYPSLNKDPLVSTSDSSLLSPLPSTQLSTPPSAELNAPVLEWHKDIMPLLEQKLSDLPKLRIDIHLPKNLTT